MKKVLGFIAASMLLAAPAMAADAPTYNCDYQPACEVAPGIYGAMTSPVKSKFDLSIGGFARLDYAYNSVNLGPSGFLAPNGGIPVAGTVGFFNTGNQDQSILSARVSRFWLKSTGPTFLGAKTSGLIEADFLGDPSAAAESAQLRMRQAYGALDWANTQVLFGQTADIFGPAVSNTVDFRQGAATGTPNQPRVPQLRLTQKIPLGASNSIKLVIGVQDPNQDKNGNSNNVAGTTALTTPGGGTAVTQSATLGISSYGSAVNVAGQLMFISKALGQAPGLYGLAMNNLTLGVFGLVGSQKITTATAGTSFGHAVDVYGYGVYGFIPVLGSKDGKSRAMTMSLETQAYISAGMTFNSANGNALTNSATATGAKGYGMYGQMIFYPIQDLGLTAGYERRNALNMQSLTAASAEVYNENMYANVAYDLNAAVRVAAEYEHLRTQYRGIAANTVGNLGQANILRMAMYYFF